MTDDTEQTESKKKITSERGWIGWIGESLLATQVSESKCPGKRVCVSLGLCQQDLWYC